MIYFLPYEQTKKLHDIGCVFYSEQLYEVPNGRILYKPSEVFNRDMTKKYMCRPLFAEVRNFLREQGYHVVMIPKDEHKWLAEIYVAEDGKVSKVLQFDDHGDYDKVKLRCIDICIDFYIRKIQDERNNIGQ